jgi:phage shock protein PspC (stress-responsive transcriptional regulator)
MSRHRYDGNLVAMTDTTFVSPRLERPREAPLGGVCLALARTTGTEPVLWRVLFVVLIVFGGIGFVLYLGACCVIPREGEEHSLVERLVHGPDRRISSRQALLLALVVITTIFALHDNADVVAAAAACALVYMWWHRRHPSPAPPLTAPLAPPAAPVTESAAEPVPPAGEATAAVPPYVAPVWAPPAPRPRSVLTPLTLSAAALVVGVLLLVAAVGSVSVPTDVVLAAALAVVGIGLVASAFFGRARGLVPTALLLALALAATFGARPAIDHGIGERHWRAVDAGSYRLGIGDATLLLPDRPPTGHWDVRADVTLGHLKVVVPRGVHAIISTHVQNGDVQGPGVDQHGRDVSPGFDLGPVDAPPIFVHANVSVGMVEVRGG